MMKNETWVIPSLILFCHFEITVFGIIGKVCFGF